MGKYTIITHYCVMAYDIKETKRVDFPMEKAALVFSDYNLYLWEISANCIKRAICQLKYQDRRPVMMRFVFYIGI